MENIVKFQPRVHDFVIECFGADIAYDKVERNHRFLEEALELVQSIGCTREDALMLVDYVYGRPSGETNQEIGGVMVTLAALCNAGSRDMERCGETELKRVWGKIDKIREKQKNKPRNSPLPAQPQQSFSREEVGQLLVEYRKDLAEVGGPPAQPHSIATRWLDQKLNIH